MADHDEDGKREGLLPCGMEAGDCCAAGSGCDVCGHNPANSEREELCGHCNGSGEGMHPGTRCQWCKGSGVERETKEGPGPDDGPGEE